MSWSCEIPIEFDRQMVVSFPSLRKRKGTFVKETEIRDEAIKVVADRTNLSENQMSAAVVKKPKTSDELNVTDNSNDNVMVDDIDKMKVSYEGEQPWSCERCQQLEKVVEENQRTLQETNRKLNEFMLKVDTDKENDALLVAGGELVSKLYNKLYKYALSLGLPANVEFGEFLDCSDADSTSEFKIYFTDSLNNFGISLEDFQILRGMKRERNQRFHKKESTSELLQRLKSAKLNDFTHIVNIIEKYPLTFK